MKNTMTQSVKRLTFVSHLFFAALFVGCGAKDDGKPADMPPLFPATLTFTQEGAALDGATIILHSDSKWSVRGRTDNQGKVQLSTNGYYDGVPEGSYKITVQKIAGTLDPATGELVRQTDVIDPALQRPETTTLEIDIVKGNNDKAFDVGKAANINIPISD